MDTRANVEPQLFDLGSDRRCAADRPGWAVEACHDPVASGVCFAAPIVSELRPGESVVTFEFFLPNPVTKFAQHFGGIGDIDKQNGCQYAIVDDLLTNSGNEFLDIADNFFRLDRHYGVGVPGILDKPCARYSLCHIAGTLIALRIGRVSISEFIVS